MNGIVLALLIGDRERAPPQSTPTADLHERY
jgi:hypothetical protein